MLFVWEKKRANIENFQNHNQTSAQGMHDTTENDNV